MEKIKLTILAERECFFLPHLSARMAREGLVESIVVLNKKPSLWKVKKNLQNLICALGFRGFLRLLLDLFFVKVLNLVARNKYYSLEKVANNFCLPLFYVNDLNSSEFKKIMTELNSNVIFAQVSQKIKPELLGKAFFINKHCSLLPKFSGIFPVFWAMLQGELELGVTVHKMDIQFDTGPILRQAKISTNGHSFFSAYHELYSISFDLIRDWCLEPNRDYVLPITDRTYHSYPSYKNLLEFRRSGLKIGSALNVHDNVTPP